jgi:hypothetical protein
MAPSPERSGLEPGTGEVVDAALLQELGAWLGQLVRALKTSRLYDESNPAVQRAREDLAGALSVLLAQRGGFCLQVGAHGISHAGHPLQSTSPGDESLAAALHRDGIRQLALEPGIEARELNTLLGLILKVTGPAAGDDDLVTLLWDADLPHVLIDSVPLEGDVDGVADEDGDPVQGSAWPRRGGGAQAPAVTPDASADRPTAGVSGAASPAQTLASRSDDCTTGEGPADVEQAFDELETGALHEIARFQQEYAQEREETVTARVLRMLEDCMVSALTDPDREVLATYLPGLLRETIEVGDWRRAMSALALLRSCQPEWSVEVFCQELCEERAATTRRVVALLDGQDAAAVAGFLELAVHLGAAAGEWLIHVLIDSQQKDVRQPLARTIAELVADQPERVLPWLSDSRWYVVRNAVHILGRIGEDVSPEYLRVPAEHPEMRVRQEVIAALSQASSNGARSLLLSMLGAAEPPLFIAILQRLALDSHPSVQDGLLALLRDEAFPGRSEPERRALLGALATRGDAALPALEEELHAGGWMSRRPEPDHTAIALCVARIATPAAKAVLERGLRTGRKVVRKACRIAGASGEMGDE